MAKKLKANAQSREDALLSPHYRMGIVAGDKFTEPFYRILQ